LVKSQKRRLAPPPASAEISGAAETNLKSNHIIRDPIRQKIFMSFESIRISV